MIFLDIAICKYNFRVFGVQINDLYLVFNNN